MWVVPVAARLSFATTLGAALVLFGTAFARQAELLGYEPAHLLLLIGTGIGLLALIASFGWWFARLASGDTRGARWGYIGLVAAIAIMITPLNMLRLALTMPALNDITTDPEAPPQLGERAPAYDGQRQVAYDGETMTAIEAQKRAYPDVRPFKVIQPEMALYWRAFEAAKKRGWNVAGFDKVSRTVIASDHDFWSGNVCDIGIRVRRSGMGARLDIRSRSRFGNTDAGANAAIIKDYFKELSER
jgi:hypothetical protein